MPPGAKAARLLERTATGGAIVLVLAGLLWAASWSESGLVVLVMGWLLALASLAELSRMGSLRGRELGWSLLPALVALLLLGLRSMEQGGTYLPLQLLAVVMLAVAGRGAFQLFAAGGAWRTALAALVLGWSLVPLFPAWILGPGALVPWLAPAAIAGGVLGGISRRGAPADLLAGAAIAVWLIPPLPWLVHVWARFGTGGLVALVVLAKAGDVAGYYVGSSFGRRRPFPRVSPGKTVAGCVASLAAGAVAGAALHVAGVVDARGGVLGGILVGLLTNVAAQAGDLLESYVKRRAGVKDSGSLFGPSGGVLDLVDSLLLAVPVALALWPLLLHPSG